MDLTISPYAPLPLLEPNNRNDLGLRVWLEGDRKEREIKKKKRKQTKKKKRVEKEKDDVLKVTLWQRENRDKEWGRDKFDKVS